MFVEEDIESSAVPSAGSHMFLSMICRVSVSGFSSAFPHDLASATNFSSLTEGAMRWHTFHHFLEVTLTRSILLPRKKCRDGL